MTRQFTPQQLRAYDNGSASDILEKAGSRFDTALKQANQTFVTDPNAERAATWDRVKADDQAKLKLAQQQAIQQGTASFDKWQQTGQQEFLNTLQQPGWVDQNALAQFNFDNQGKAEAAQVGINQGKMEDFASNLKFGTDETLNQQEIVRKAKELGVSPQEYLASFAQSRKPATLLNEGQKAAKVLADAEYEKQRVLGEDAKRQALAQAQIANGITQEDLDPATYDIKDVEELWGDTDQLSDVTPLGKELIGRDLTNAELMKLHTFAAAEDGIFDTTLTDKGNKIITSKAEAFITGLKGAEDARQLRLSKYNSQKDLIDVTHTGLMAKLDAAKVESDRQRVQNSINNYYQEGDGSFAQYGGSSDDFRNQLSTLIADKPAVTGEATPDETTSTTDSLFKPPSRINTVGINPELFEANKAYKESSSFLWGHSSNPITEDGLKSMRREVTAAEDKLIAMKAGDSTVEDIDAQEALLTTMKQQGQQRELLLDNVTVSREQGKRLARLNKGIPKGDSPRLNEKQLTAAHQILTGTPIVDDGSTTGWYDSKQFKAMANRFVNHLPITATEQAKLVRKLGEEGTTGDSELDEVIRSNIRKEFQVIDPETYNEPVQESLVQPVQSQGQGTNTSQTAVLPTTNASQVGQVLNQTDASIQEKDHLMKIFQAESGFDSSTPNKSGDSSAMGLGQVTQETKKLLIAKYPKQFTALDDLTNPATNTQYTLRLLRDNADSFRKTNKREPKTSELYMYHHFGPRTGQNIIDESLENPFTEIPRKGKFTKIIKANPKIFPEGATYKDVVDNLNARVS